MKKTKSLFKNSTKKKPAPSKLTLEIVRLKSENELKVFRILEKIPYSHHKSNTPIIVNDRLMIEEKDKEYLKSVISENVKNIENKNRMSRMRNKIDDIFQTKLSIDKTKYSTFFRKGLSESEKKTFIKDNTKITFPCLQKKRDVDNKINRHFGGEIDLKQQYIGVSLFRQKVFKDHHDIIDKEVMIMLNRIF